MVSAAPKTTGLLDFAGFNDSFFLDRETVIDAQNMIEMQGVCLPGKFTRLVWTYVNFARCLEIKDYQRTDAIGA